MKWLISFQVYLKFIGRALAEHMLNPGFYPEYRKKVHIRINMFTYTYAMSTICIIIAS
jgi:hypothetical protein